MKTKKISSGIRGVLLIYDNWIKTIQFTDSKMPEAKYSKEVQLKDQLLILFGEEQIR